MQIRAKWGFIAGIFLLLMAGGERKGTEDNCTQVLLMDMLFKYKIQLHFKNKIFFCCN